MRYLFQQMIAFWAIILTILIVVGVSFTQFTKRTILTNTYDQMQAYADSIQENSQEDPGMLNNSLLLTELALKNQNINFFYINADKVVEYPSEKQGQQVNFISKSNWKKVQNGEGVSTSVEFTTSTNSKIHMAMVLKPLFIINKSTNESQFYGTIAVLQPTSNIENSMSGLTENLFKAFLISSIFSLIFSYMLAQFQVNRINRMKKAARQIAEGNFDVNLEVKSNDELDELATDFNRMAQALKESNEEIERQEDRRRQFMADAAHEMRTPLTTINGLLEGIAYNAIPKDQEEKCIQLMRNETTRLIRLVNENLDYEKIRTNQISMVIQKFSATDTLKQVVQQLQGKAEASGNQLSLTTTDEIEVYADYDRFVQIMVNIIQNAIQFTQDGEITVSVERGYLETTVKISDTGIGMTEEEVQNIWERYYKVDPSRKNTKYGESGLGLSIVHQLVKLHKGTITVESEKDVGTTFNVTFPDEEARELIEEPKESN
ncbi:HAMP domain-containing histidine kinase [Vagococcus sp. BWB3-3]|uniref:histidine kinase n=1 Tax=Vagococcus allomyrinae TaxID=2794353 RepID=A0A940PHS2_9ENTE|nr:HAMP domain-containing sensor histidine kinase [Vagococcus allomyrinae]MBP1043821.1 HAMP domain-containing histidine kinase [Vagococcus allomyrinae]